MIAHLFAVVLLSGAPSKPNPVPKEAEDAFLPERASAADEWAANVCPDRGAPCNSNVECKARAAAKRDCVGRAMVKALDQVLVPLKKADPKAFAAGMAQQKAFNPWRSEACKLAEDTFWMNLESGVHEDGTARGTIAVACEQKMDATRGLQAAAAVDAKNWAPKWRAALDQAASERATHDAALEKYRALVKAARDGASRRPAAERSDPRFISEADLTGLEQRMERALGTAEALGKADCPAQPAAGLAQCERERISLYRSLLEWPSEPR